MKKQYKLTLLILTAALAVAGCASTAPSATQLDQLAAKAVKASFRDQGIVKVSTLDTDETNKACSAADVAGKPLDPVTATKLARLKFRSARSVRVFTTLASFAA